MLVEAAITLPLLIMILLGVVTYGLWFMSAHSIQQAANEGARAALAAIDDDEREAIVRQTVADGVVSVGTVNPQLVSVETRLDQNLFTVSVSYDASRDTLFTMSLIPMPDSSITRTARVRLTSL